MKKNEYGLITTIAMIVGVVIGSGIFFKSNKILEYTEGNILLGVAVFCIAAIAIIFGCLTFAELASRNNKPGGIIAYAEMSYGKSCACAFGWFQTFLYFPTIIAVVSYFGAEYICMLFGIKDSLSVLTVIGALVIAGIFLINIVSAKIGGIFQNTATTIKLIPLLIIAVIGTVYGNSDNIISVADTIRGGSHSWLSAIVPIAFSFDGWIAATSIGHEVKDSKKNLPRALVIAPIFILIVYVSYFFGISTYLGPDTILAEGDSHVYTAANQIFGSLGAKFIVTCITISIIGTVNGLIMALIRQPYSLAIRGMFPKAEAVSKINERFDMPVRSGIISMVLTLLWFFVHCTMVKLNITGIDISEGSVIITYAFYALLYVKVLKMGMSKEINSKLKGIVNPILAILGSIMILCGSIDKSLFWIYVVICIVISAAAMNFCKKQNLCGIQSEVSEID